MTVARIRQPGGWTLVSLLTALAVAAVILGLAIPSFNGLLARNRLVASVNAVVGALHAARQAAVETGQPVAFCAGRPSTGCDGDWSQRRWLVFVDADHNGELGQAEAALLSGAIVVDDLQIKGNGPFHTAVLFMPLGSSHHATGAFAAGTLRLCSQAAIGEDSADLILARSGRIRIDHHDFDGSCPAP